jgi:proteasome assembly chaperone (PAC2) family protein
MSRLFKIKARPRLKSPILLAAWPGIGNVSMILTGYLQQKLTFRALGELDASYFFDPIGVVARDNVVQAPQFPGNHFLYHKGKEGQRDLILFIGDDQPSSRIYEYAGAVLDVGARFQIDRVITCAAALTQIHLTEQPKVWGVVTDQSLAKELAEYDLAYRGNIQIAGLNGLLLGVAKEKSIKGICLLGEVPAHTSRVENPTAALAILNVLTRMLGVEIDTTELSESARETQEQIKQATAIAMGQYIEHFTQPIWEQGDDDGEEEYDEYDDE